MNLIENIKEGLRSIYANLLRSVLTALIVAIGITCLVGALTAVDGIGYTLTESLSSLGANSFYIESKRNRNRQNNGINEKRFPPLQLNDVQHFIDRYQVSSIVALNAELSWNAEVKYRSKKSNPNVVLQGVNDEYMALNSLNLSEGRNLSKREIDYGTKVAVIGYKIYTQLFEKNELAVGKEISFKGVQFRVIGVMAEKGQLSQDNYDSMVLFPILVANQMASGRYSRPHQDGYGHGRSHRIDARHPSRPYRHARVLPGREERHPDRDEHHYGCHPGSRLGYRFHYAARKRDRFNEHYAGVGH